MILVDTTVLIDALKGAQNSKTVLFRRLLDNEQQFGFSEYTYLEVLQGARDNSEYVQLKEYLLEQHIFFLPKTLETYDRASQIYFSLKRQGVTPRSSVDILIALTAIEYNLPLLHNDKDFDLMSSKLPQLLICDA